VAESDPDRTAAAFFAPARARADLFALYAFDRELARVRDVVREPLAGQMRFAWWRDQVNRIASGGRLESPAGQALSAAVKTHSLPLDLVQGLIDARSQELSETPFPDDASFEAYAQGAETGVMRLAARICGAGAGADAVAVPAGRLVALIGTLRHLGRDASRRHCRVPLSVLAAYRIGPEDVFARDEPRVAPVIAAMMAKSKEAVLDARRLTFPAEARAAILPAVLARQYIRVYERRSFHPFTEEPRLRPVTAGAALAMAAWSRRL
jgi:phytoene/squalene synthetase